MREKSKYLKMNKSTRTFTFNSFIFLQYVFLAFYSVFRK